MTIIETELDYSPKDCAHGTYTMSKVQPIGGTTCNITNAGGNEVTFDLHPNVFNLAQSKLCFTLTPNAGGAGNYNWIHADGLAMIRQIQLISRSGSLFMDINEFATYTNMIFRRETKLEDFLTWSRPGVLPTAITGEPFEGLSPINTAGAAFDRPTGGSVSTPYNEARYVFTGSVANNATPVIDYKIDLDKIKNTILSLNKDLWFRETISLKINWHPTSKFCWASTNVTANDPATGHVASPGVTLSNLALYLAIEQDQNIITGIKARAESAEGYQLKVPFTIVAKQGYQQATTHNVSSRFTRAQGERLMKIYYAPYVTNDTLEVAYDHNNAITGAGAATKINNYYTSINGVKTTQLPFYDCSLRDDYICDRRKNRGNAIQSANEYYYNWVHVEDFTDNYSQYEKPLMPDQSTYIDGLDLNLGEVQWDLYANTQNLALNHYIAAVLQRSLIVNSAGIFFA